MRKGKCNKTGDNTTKLCGPGTHTHKKEHERKQPKLHSQPQNDCSRNFPKSGIKHLSKCQTLEKKKKKKMNETTVGGHKT